MPPSKGNKMENEERIIILDHIKNTCKRKCIFPVVVIVLMIALLFIVPFRSIWSHERVNGIFNAKPNEEFVTISTGPMKYTGYDIKNGLGHQFCYYYSLKDGKCAFALIPKSQVVNKNSNLPKESVKQEITNVTYNAKVISSNGSYEKMISLFAKDLNWTDEGLKSISTGIVVSAADYHPYRYIIVFALILFLIGVALVRLIIAIRGLKDPYSYPVCSFLSKEESHDLIDEAQDELDSENYLQINATYITENYFIDLDTSGASVIPLKDVVWVYRLGKRGVDIKKQALTYTINFITRDGVLIKVPRKSSDEALAIMKSIKATEYEIVTGHSDEKRQYIKELIDKNRE